MLTQEDIILPIKNNYFEFKNFKMPILVPLSVEIFICFALSSLLLFRYADFVNQNIVTTVAVFISWFLSFMVIFALPADISSTAYHQCLLNQASHNDSTVPNTTTIFQDNNITASDTRQIGFDTINLTNLKLINNTQTNNAENFNLNIKNISSHENDKIQNEIECKLPWSYVPDHVLPRLWRFIYWTSQFLTWIILPLMQSYCMSGYFSAWAKLKSSLKANLIYYSSLGVIFFILLVYVVINNGLDFSKLKVIAITSSNTWGLLLLVVLLGYGLVELPRYLLSRSQSLKSLDRIYYRVARINAEKCEAEEKLDDVLEDIHQAHCVIGDGSTLQLRRCLDKITQKCPPDWQKRSVSFRRQAVNSAHTPTIDYLQLSTLIKLHKRVIQAVHFHRQTSCRWSQIIREAIDWEDVVLNQTDPVLSSVKMFQRSLHHNSPTTLIATMFHNIYTPRVEWYWKCLVRSWLLKTLAIVTIIMSVAVVWSEMTFFIYSPTLSIFAALINSAENKQNYFFMEMTSIISIGYLALCAFFTVFRMRIFNKYYLSPNQQTDEYSIIFSGMLLCRLTAPLCLNYLCLIHKDSHIIHELSHAETAFTRIMGHLDLIPMVNSGLNFLLPLCISAICLALYFDMGTHIMHHLGFDQYVPGDELTNSWTENGRELVKREKTKLLRSFYASRSTANSAISVGVQPSGLTIVE